MAWNGRGTTYGLPATLVGCQHTKGTPWGVHFLVDTFCHYYHNLFKLCNCSLESPSSLIFIGGLGLRFSTVYGLDDICTGTEY